MDTIKKLWWLGVIGAYAVTSVVFGIAIAVNGGPRPVLGGIFWPVRLIRLLFGDVGE